MHNTIHSCHTPHNVQLLLQEIQQHTANCIYTVFQVPRGMSPDMWGSSSGREHVLLSPSSTKHTCTQTRNSERKYKNATIYIQTLYDSALEFGLTPIQESAIARIQNITPGQDQLSRMVSTSSCLVLYGETSIGRCSQQSSIWTLQTVCLRTFYTYTHAWRKGKTNNWFFTALLKKNTLLC